MRNPAAVAYEAYVRSMEEQGVSVEESWDEISAEDQRAWFAVVNAVWSLRDEG